MRIRIRNNESPTKRKNLEIKFIFGQVPQNILLSSAWPKELEEKKFGLLPFGVENFGVNKFGQAVLPHLYMQNTVHCKVKFCLKWKVFFTV